MSVTLVKCAICGGHLDVDVDGYICGKCTASMAEDAQDLHDKYGETEYDMLPGGDWLKILWVCVFLGLAAFLVLWGFLR